MKKPHEKRITFNRNFAAFLAGQFGVGGIATFRDRAAGIKGMQRLGAGQIRQGPGRVERAHFQTLGTLFRIALVDGERGRKRQVRIAANQTLGQILFLFSMFRI